MEGGCGSGGVGAGVGGLMDYHFVVLFFRLIPSPTHLPTYPPTHLPHLIYLTCLSQSPECLSVKLH